MRIHLEPCPSKRASRQLPVDPAMDHPQGLAHLGPHRQPAGTAADLVTVVEDENRWWRRTRTPEGRATYKGEVGMARRYPARRGDHTVSADFCHAQ